MSEPEIDTPADLIIAEMEKLERKAIRMTESAREDAERYEKEAELYRAVITALRGKTERLPP